MNPIKRQQCISYLQTRRYCDSENTLVIRTIELLELHGITDADILNTDPRDLADIIMHAISRTKVIPSRKHRVVAINRYIDFLRRAAA